MSSQGPYGRHGYSVPNTDGSTNPSMGYSTPQYGGYGGSAAGSSSGYATPGGYSQSYPPMNQSMGNNGSMAGIGSNQPDQSEDKTSKKGLKKSVALQSLNQNVLMWAAFFTVSIFVYYFISGGDFSFIMTYGAMSRMFGFLILNVKTFTSKRATGVSVKSLQLYVIVFACRLSSIVRHEGYLPYDKSGDWLYHLIEFLSFAFTASALYGCLKPFRSTYEESVDKFGELNVPSGWGGVYLAAPVLILAILIHPNLNTDFLSDVAWTYAMYLESVALIPQLYMFQKNKNGVIELLTAHFVAALGFGRLLEFIFWAYSYQELSGSSGSKLPGYLAILAQLLQMVLMVDFFWYYAQAVKNATPLVLPSHNSAGLDFV